MIMIVIMMKIKFPNYEIELSIEELKELSVKNKSDIKAFSPDSSNKPQINNNMDQVKQIKYLVKEGFDNKTIAKRLNVSPQFVNYWRKNNPKRGLYDNKMSMV